MANEVYYLAISGAILLAIAFTIPFITDEFENTSTDYDTDSLTEGYGTAPSTTDAIFTTFANLFKAFVWSFGTFPFWLEGFLLLVRIVFVASIIKLLPTT